MSQHKIEYDCECTSCNGTGLYVGMAEHDGFAVVCSDCKGTGKQHEIIKYKDFEGKKRRANIVRVVKTNPGIGLGVGNGCTIDSFGGMPYKDWFDGKRFPNKSEMRNFTCPTWWYQCEDYNKKPKWDECIWGGSFSGCKHFPAKQLCWDKFDKEHCQ